MLQRVVNSVLMIAAE